MTTMRRLLRCSTAVILVFAALCDARQLAQSGDAAPGAIYIAAEQVEWDYVPGGANQCARPGLGGGIQGDENAWRAWGSAGLGSVFKRAAYVQYSDATFTERVPKPKEFEHTGMLGPVLRVHAGETVTVVFLNRLPFKVNMEPAGLQPGPGYEAPEEDPATVAFAPAAAPNETVTYTWFVPEDAAPRPGEAAYKLWLYRSGVNVEAHDCAGLMGPILVGRSAASQQALDASSAAAPEADRDIIMVLQNIKEFESPFYDDNLAGRNASGLGLASDTELEDSLVKHAMNGYLFCSGPRPEMVQGERVRWHVAAVGSEGDLHNLHWHGNTFERHGVRDDQVKLLPSSSVSVLMDADNAGTWLLHCHVNMHLGAGMAGLYTVLPGPDSAAVEQQVAAELTGVTRRYYVAAEEVVWDYAPLGGEMCSGTLQPWSVAAATFVENGTDRIGSRYLKAQYFEYTDATFTQRKERTPDEAYMGLMGPILRGEVGDTLEVVFLNRLRYPATMHPHGVRYDKASEGSPYNDGTAGNDTLDDAVAPGATHTYIWQVPETAAPGPAGGSTRLWMYHSHTQEIADTYAGLFGGIVVGTRGALEQGTLAAKDVDREVVLFFSVMDEGTSLYYNDNLDLFLGGYDPSEAAEAVSDGEGGASDGAQPDGEGGAQTAAEAFAESNLMHVINGFVFCNMPPLRFILGQRVRFYVMALGTEVDMHTPNMERTVWREPSGASAMPALSMLPGSMHTVDATAQSPGQALVQCRIGDHIAAGMTALYVVEKPATAPAQQPPVTHRYYIAAEPVEWDYAPLGYDGCTGKAFGAGASVFVDQEKGSTIGTQYKKGLYRQYTDGSFTQQVEQPAEQGILGPTIHLEAGQRFEVVFRNDLGFPINLHFDGALLAEHAQQEGAQVAPGSNFTYTYTIPESMAPGTSDLSTAAYAYTSLVDPELHPNAGLIGLLLVAAPGSLRPAGDAPVSVATEKSRELELGNGEGSALPAHQQLLPEGVDRLVPLLFNIQNENESPFLAENMAAAGVTEPGDAFEESNLMHCVNGYVYCNGPDIEVPANTTTRFVLLGMGSEADLHSPVFVGQVLRSGNSTSRTAELLPTVTRVVDVVAAAPGRWPFYCDVHDHLLAGMQGTLVVTD